MSGAATRILCALVAGLSLSFQLSASNIRTLSQDSQPKFIQGQGGMTGLCIDIFRAIEKVDPSLKTVVPHTFTPLPRIELMMEEGSIDVVCGLADTKGRREKMDIIAIPLYTTSLVLAARMDETANPKTFEELRKLGDDVVVLTVTQTVQADFATAAGLKVDSQARDTSQNLQKLVRGRGRFILHNDFALVDEIERDKLGDKVKLLSGSFATEGRYMYVSRKASPDIKNKMIAALDKLSRSGELVRIFAPYKPK